MLMRKDLYRKSIRRDCWQEHWRRKYPRWKCRASFSPGWKSFTFKGMLSVEDINVKAIQNLPIKEFFNIFSYPLLQGSESKVLSDRFGSDIRTLARNLFRTTEM